MCDEEFDLFQCSKFKMFKCFTMFKCSKFKCSNASQSSNVLGAGLPEEGGLLGQQIKVITTAEQFNYYRSVPTSTQEIPNPSHL